MDDLYLIAGYDTGYRKDIVYLNVVHNTVEFDSSFILSVQGLRAVITQYQLFTFGGYDGSSYWNYIIYSNTLPSLNYTTPPSPIPTIQPTFMPTAPTNNPTNLPALSPTTKAPTTIPSELPSD